MFPSDEAMAILDQPDDCLTADELEHRSGLVRQLNTWVDEREALFRSALGALDAER